MSLLDTYSDSLGLAATSAVPLPKPAPQPRLSLWGLTTAAPKGVAAAGAERAGFASDVLGAFGQVLGAYPEAMGADLNPEQRKQADEARTKLLTEGVDFSSEAGDLFRGVARGYRPDAQTASTAETVVFGLSRGLAKIAADVVTMGPGGALVSGLDEASMVADDLKQEGVPLGARTAAGAVQGGFMAGGAVLPMAGPTLKATAALYLAGGPAGFMAQQAITRHILENAGQDKAAAQFDPFDPVGLAVASIIPLPFAHYGLKANRAAQAEAFRAGPVPSEPTPLANSIAEAYAPEHVDAARVMQLVEQRQRANVGEPGDLPAMARHEAALAKAEDQIAAGERVSVADEAPMPDESVYVWHGSPHKFDAFDASKIGTGEGAQAYGHGLYLAETEVVAKQYADNVKDMGAVKRINDEMSKLADAMSADAIPGAYRKYRTDAGAQAAKRYDELLDEKARIRADPGVMYKVAIPKAVVGKMLDWDKPLSQQAPEVKAALEKSFGFALTDDWKDAKYIDRKKKASMQTGADYYKSRITSLGTDAAVSADLIGKGIPGIRYLDGGSRGAGDGTSNFVVFPGEEAALRIVERNGTPFEQFAARISEAVAKAEEAAPRQPKAPNAEPRQVDAGNPQPVPERAAGDGTTASPGDGAEAKAAGSRLAEVSAQFPELQVMLDGMDSPMRLADFLASVKAEADEMNADAPLLQVAAECALLNPTFRPGS